jgi:hypothetical protein
MEERTPRDAAREASYEARCRGSEISSATVESRAAHVHLGLPDVRVAHDVAHASSVASVKAYSTSGGRVMDSSPVT